MRTKTKTNTHTKPQKSWITTAVGICGALALVLGAVAAQFDGDPETVANWGTTIPIAASILGIGVKARDHGVSSQAAGV